jgi:hypothetical protein
MRQLLIQYVPDHPDRNSIPFRQGLQVRPEAGSVPDPQHLDGGQPSFFEEGSDAKDFRRRWAGVNRLSLVGGGSFWEGFPDTATGFASGHVG